ncbi:hypothetical protein P885DRAFT_71081 [Corynascus similis CBS 632.67]
MPNSLNRFHGRTLSYPIAATQYGTGFHIDIPGAKYLGVDVNVIIIAGHNLISQDGTKSTKPRVCSKGVEKASWSVPQEKVKICPEHGKNPKRKWGDSEYSLQKFMASKIQVSGYTIRSGETGVLRYNSKKEWPTGLKQMSYKAPTESGMSGSLGADKSAPNISQGTNAAQRSERLKAATTHQFSAERLYLRFSSLQTPGLVRLGADELDTRIPDGPKNINENRPTVVLRCFKPSEALAARERRQDHWVVLDSTRNLTFVSSTVHKNSAFLLVRLEAQGPFGIIPVQSPNVQLTLGSEYIRREYSCYGPVESSEVSFTSYHGTSTSFRITRMWLN